MKLPGILGNVSENGLENIGLAVFRGDKFVGALDNVDTICHLIITSKLKKAAISIADPFNPNGIVDVNINMRRKGSTLFYLINSVPYIDIEVYLEASILSESKNIDYANPSNIALLKASVEAYLKEHIDSYLYKTSREFKSDIAGFGKYARTNYMTIPEWKASNWLENYQNSFFNVIVHVNIENSNLYNKQ